MYCEFLSGNAYSPKAYKVMREFEKKVEKAGIILLERQCGIRKRILKWLGSSPLLTDDLGRSRTGFTGT